MTGPLLDASIPEIFRPNVCAALEEIEGEVHACMGGHARNPEMRYVRAVRKTIQLTIACFVDSLTRAEPDWTDLLDRYTRLGAAEARRGHSLATLQTALGASGQVACRRFIRHAYRLRWPQDTLSALTDTLFALLAAAANAAAQGYARQQGYMATDRERYRARLLDVLVREPPPDLATITDHAEAAHWAVPHMIAVVALPSSARPASRILPPDVLANWEPPRPFLVVPDPDSPGQERLRAVLRHVRTAAVGPTVPVTRSAISLRWAAHAVTLIERGVFPSRPPVRCIDNVAILAAHLAADLLDSAATAMLGPLLTLPPERRSPLLNTLLVYLQCGENAVGASKQLAIHEQTVRYRLRRIHELSSLQLDDPAVKLNLMTTLCWLTTSC